MKGRGQGDPVADFIALASDPKSYSAKLDELAERALKAEAAEAAAATASKELAGREKALVERAERVLGREVAVQVREDGIVVKETPAREQTEVADAMVIQVRPRQA